MRICSFQPGATEIVYALGLQEHLYGVTANCDYPADAKTKPVIVRSVFHGLNPSSGEITQTIAQSSGKARACTSLMKRHCRRRTQMFC